MSTPCPHCGRTPEPTHAERVEELARRIEAKQAHEQTLRESDEAFRARIAQIRQGQQWVSWDRELDRAAKAQGFNRRGLLRVAGSVSAFCWAATLWYFSTGPIAEDFVLWLHFAALSLAVMVMAEESGPSAAEVTAAKLNAMLDEEEAELYADANQG